MELLKTLIAKSTGKTQSGDEFIEASDETSLLDIDSNDLSTDMIWDELANFGYFRFPDLAQEIL